ncbi:MAG TPA: lytic transglycosylase domain-containing protein [Thermoanaerobaculia bacterium]|nr:lytic transglycosylase domain-containing protein [Thermoanaerobaculia bacterium]
MKNLFVIAVTLVLAAGVAPAGERKFSAADVPAAGLRKPGRVVISNDAKQITAHRFEGNIREALVILQSARRLATRHFGEVLFDSRARATAVPGRFSPVIEEAAREHGVDPRLIAAVARRESAWNPNAVSSAGASGLMQLMPATARYLGVTNVFDVRQNIFGGTRYLRQLLDTFDGDLDLALAAYNAGPGAVQKYKGIPPYRETRAYVKAVRATYEVSLQP